MFRERRRIVTEQMAELQKTLDMINFKCAYYEDAIASSAQNRENTGHPN